MFNHSLDPQNYLVGRFAALRARLALHAAPRVLEYHTSHGIGHLQALRMCSRPTLRASDRIGAGLSTNRARTERVMLKAGVLIQ